MNRLTRHIILLAVALLALATASCSSATDKRTEAPKQKNELKYAERLRMYQRDGYTVAEILADTPDRRVEQSYVLVPKGVTPPASDPNVTVIPVPISKALVYTSVHAGALDELGAPEVVKAVADAGYFKLPFVTDGLASGAIRDVGASSSPSSEKIIELAPQAIIVNQYQGADYHTIDKLGIPVVKMAENLEQTPLGRAEWLKFIGALVGEREKADSVFSAVEKSYLAVSKQAKSLSKHPKVMTETMYEGVWNMAGGGSYQARLIADAGGDYIWKDDKTTGSLALNFEQVLERGADADIWLLNVFGYELTRDALMKLNPRYKNFAPVDHGGVYYCNSAEKPLFEDTPFHPDRLLADYIAIFSGADTPLRYYRQMTK